MAYKGGPGGLLPGLGHSTELTYFVTGSVMFSGFSCISQLTYPTQNPLLTNRSC